MSRKIDKASCIFFSSERQGRSRALNFGALALNFSVFAIRSRCFLRSTVNGAHELAFAVCREIHTVSSLEKIKYKKTTSYSIKLIVTGNMWFGKI